MLTYISDKDILTLNISPLQSMEWVKEAFFLKESSLLPHKISITYGGGGGKFLNTMPTVMPAINAMGVKVVSRYPERNPTIDGQILYYDYMSGALTHILDAAWITAARTGAVCAVAVQTLAVKDFSTVAILGLGSTGRASLACILAANAERPLRIKVLRYKDHAEKFIASFREYPLASFEICEDMRELVTDADVVVSCITRASGLLAQPEWFKPGCLLVPVHTRGFQTCDLVFDKVFADDTAHVANFNYFSQFRKFAELGDVMRGQCPGRERDAERILSYNIGIALHDIVFSRHIIRMLTQQAEASLSRNCA